jgi:hypothetical protein
MEGFDRRVSSSGGDVIHRPDRSKDVTKAIRVLRRHGVPVGFPMQTANGEIIFAIGKDFTITADQVLELLDLGELHAEGVHRLAQAQASATLMLSFLRRYG